MSEVSAAEPHRQSTKSVLPKEKDFIQSYSFVFFNWVSVAHIISALRSSVHNNFHATQARQTQNDTCRSFPEICHHWSKAESDLCVWHMADLWWQMADLCDTWQISDDTWQISVTLWHTMGPSEAFLRVLVKRGPSHSQARMEALS